MLDPSYIKFHTKVGYNIEKPLSRWLVVGVFVYNLMLCRAAGQQICFIILYIHVLIIYGSKYTYISWCPFFRWLIFFFLSFMLLYNYPVHLSYSYSCIMITFLLCYRFSVRDWLHVLFYYFHLNIQIIFTSERELSIRILSVFVFIILLSCRHIEWVDGFGCGFFYIKLNLVSKIII